MIDFNKPVSQHSHFTGVESELLVNYFVKNEKRDYEYDNVVFAHVAQGMKKIDIPTVSEIDLLPEMVIMGTQKLSAKVTLPVATIAEPTLCFTLEVSKDKVWRILDKINESYSIPSLMKEEQKLNSTSVYFGAGGQMVLDTLQKIQKLLIEDVIYKDYWISLKIEELVLCSLQTDMRNTLLSGYAESQNQLNDHPLGHAVKYIKDNLYTRINIETLADKACMSKATFFRQFKHNFGMSPITYMHAQRIKEAQMLLKNTNKSVSDIGYRLGYTNASYFSTQFEKVVKCSPGQYRKKLSIY